MKRMDHFYFCCAVSLCLFSTAAVAEDLNPPSWRGDPYTTVQKWEWWNPTLTQPATDWDSPFGPMEIEIYDSGPGLSYAAYDPVAGCWMWEISDMSIVFPLLHITQWPSVTPEYSHIQVTWSVDFHGAAPPYGMGDLLYINDNEAFIDGIYPASTVIGVQEMGNDGALEFYHTTYYTPRGSYLVTNAAPFIGPWPLTNEATVYVYEIVVDTKYVPEPATAVLLGLGALLLRKRRH